MEQLVSTELSKKMCYILRHNPSQFGIRLNDEGYCSVKALVGAFERQGISVTPQDILMVVVSCDKQRFEARGNFIRARYGHSKVSVKQEEAKPPSILLHGTVEQNLTPILKSGLLPMSRQYVHLSTRIGKDFAIKSARRRGKKVVLLEVDTRKAIKRGVTFFRTNGVWLATAIPSDCINWTNVSYIDTSLPLNKVN